MSKDNNYSVIDTGRYEHWISYLSEYAAQYNKLFVPYLKRLGFSSDGDLLSYVRNPDFEKIKEAAITREMDRGVPREYAEGMIKTVTADFWKSQGFKHDEISRRGATLEEYPRFGFNPLGTSMYAQALVLKDGILGIDQKRLEFLCTVWADDRQQRAINIIEKFLADMRDLNYPHPEWYFKTWGSQTVCNRDKLLPTWGSL